MSQELYFLLLAIGVGVTVGLAFLIPNILWRLIKKKPIFPKSKKLESPKILYAGIAFFGGFAIFSFFDGFSIIASTFLLLMLVYVWYLIAYKKAN